MCEGEHRYAVSMGRARSVKNTRQVDHEGEMSLNVLVDDTQVFVLSYTIVPGWVIEAPDAEVLVITRIQGSLGVFDQISNFRRPCTGFRRRCY